MGAAIACGDVLGWITQKLVGVDGVKKLLNGPSYVTANLNHISVLSPMDINGNELVAEPITVKEEKVLVGFIPGSDHREYLKGEAHAWTPKAEALMRKCWDKILDGVAFTLTMKEWGSYINEFELGLKDDDSYAYMANDSLYSVDLIKLAYPVDWTTVKLDMFVIPEAFRGYDINSRTE
ncbi:hypothetical protein ARMGADRAFT_1032212 [Armillaria gallica]|uniref:Uncharacterized protein n=1 Tax=Armillaria gallica TaxID=47427 RepID=A0A2H3D612_ARMGA|nr:hypothetical protein ARMGADRAFT_1032212 [Armillaria gallica]